MSVPNLTAYLNGKTEVCHCGQRVTRLGENQCHTCCHASSLDAARLLLNAARSGKQPCWYVLSLYGQPPVARKWCIACRTLAPLEPPGVVLPMCPNLPCELAKKYWGPTANPVHELCELFDELGIKGDLGRVSIPLDDDPKPAEPVKATEPQYGRDPRGAAFAVSRPLTAEAKEEQRKRDANLEEDRKIALAREATTKLRFEAYLIIERFLSMSAESYSRDIWIDLRRAVGIYSSTCPSKGWERGRWDEHLLPELNRHIDILGDLPIGTQQERHGALLSEFREVLDSLRRGQTPMFRLSTPDSDEKVPDPDSR